MMTACRQEMADQPRYDPLEASKFFPDGQSARPLVEGTVARGQLRDDEQFFYGGTDTTVAAEFPWPVTIEVLQRGQQRYDIYCTPCHGPQGKGDGRIVGKGIPSSDLHTDRIKRQKDGYMYATIRSGGIIMPSYNHALSTKERWAIVNYVRQLQGQ